jgi:hypothetical protein
MRIDDKFTALLETPHKFGGVYWFLLVQKEGEQKYAVLAQNTDTLLPQYSLVSDNNQETGPWTNRAVRWFNTAGSLVAKIEELTNPCDILMIRDFLRERFL